MADPQSQRAFQLAVLALAVVAGCARSPDRCERVAARILPAPDPKYVASCRAALSDPAYSKAVDCVLAVDGGVTETELKACPGFDRVLYFQF